MTDKVTLANVANLLDATTAVTTINNNSSAIVAAMDNTLSLDGTAPNQMQSNLDMNSNHILNLPSPGNMTEPMRLQDAALLNGGGSITVQGVPVAGTINQVLTKNSTADYDTSWKTPSFTLGAGQVVSSNVAANTLANSNLVQTAPATLKGNATAGATTVQDFSIVSLTPTTSPDIVNDYFLIYDHLSGTLKKINTTSISASLVAGVSSVAGQTGAITVGTGLSNVGNNILNTGITKVNIQSILASGTYTPSSGMVYCIIECVGGGGGSGSTNSGSTNSSASGGGGAGGYARKLATAAQIGSSQTVTIGVGGSGAVSGGTTSVGSLCVATGGAPGPTASNNQATAGGIGGVGTAGDIQVRGAPGGPGTAGGIVTIYACGGVGGSSMFGGGGCPVPTATSSNGANAFNYGSGAGGAASQAGAVAQASAGSAGIVIITEFLNA